MHFHQLVRRARERQGIPLKELAARAGLDPSYLSLVECGAKVPMIPNAIRIAKAVGLDVGELVAINQPSGARGAALSHGRPKKRRA